MPFWLDAAFIKHFEGQPDSNNYGAKKDSRAGKRISTRREECLGL
jgi:hypothetical protein